MKIIFKILSVLLVIIIGLQSCSRKKNNFLSRNYHAVTAEYNTLFNGYQALEKGRKSLNESYKDNYWDILPVERMQVTEDLMMPGESKNEDFSRAEEKAVKAIQKHGMNIGGKEKNPQIDEAYLLLGKSRYFDQRFIPALEAFNYILYKYPLSDKINQAKIWREKTNIRLENDEVAIENLKRLLEQEELEDQDLADATSMLAQAYINTKSLDSALTQMKIASAHTKKNFEKGRFNFIKGQLYNALQKPDSANIAFEKVIDLNRKIPRKYLIAAYLGKVRNFDYENGNRLEHEELLTRMEEYYENRPYLDHIYHEIARYHLKTGKDSLAIAYYNKSLRQATQDKKLNVENYRTLAEYYFDDAQYKTAGAYYDSTLTNLKVNSKPHRVVKRKRENLDDVIKYEDVVHANDSILRLVSMSKNNRIAYFKNHIDSLQQVAALAEEKRSIEERKKGLAQNDATPRSILKNRSTSGMNASKFYFYNEETVGFGKQEFEKIWGERRNRDNWRYSNLKASNDFDAAIELVTDATTTDSIQGLTPEMYISKIPTDQKVIDSIKTDRNFANYQLGLIYKEKFKEYELSKSKFKTVLANQPEEKLVLPSNYNLYKISELLGDDIQADFYKNNILTNFPESRYAKILSNPDYANQFDNESPDYLYAQTYALLEQQKYREVINKSNEYSVFFSDDPILPKFQLLKARALGRLRGYNAYSRALNDVSVDYANTDEGKKAKEMLQNLNALKDTTFIKSNKGKHYKAIYVFKQDEFSKIEDFKKRLSEAIKQIDFYELSISEDVYTEDTKLVVVHGIGSEQGAEGFGYILKDNKNTKPYKIKRLPFGISSENYTIVQVHKNLEAYLNQNK